MDNEEHKEISTSDIVLAAFLRCRGVQVRRIEKVGNRGQFFFHDVSAELLSDFDLGKATCEPVAFNNAVKSLTTACRRAA